MAKRVPLRYFYLNGYLHKKLFINRHEDKIVTWCYPLEKRVAYTYSSVRKEHRPAFKLTEVCKMLNRSRITLDRLLANGHIDPPQHTYGIDENKRKYQYLWSEDDVLNARAYLATVHRGRPRLDGEIRPQSLPSERELRAMMRNEDTLYVKNDDGEFVPVWKAADFN